VIGRAKNPIIPSRISAVSTLLPKKKSTKIFAIKVV